MSHESATPDLAERWRQAHEAFFRGDHGAAMSLYAPGAVWDTSFLGIGSFEGRETIRHHFEDWIAPYKEFESELEECQDLGNGVVLAVSRQKGRPAGSTGRIQLRAAFVSEWVDELIVRVTVYYDIDKARAAAER